MSRIQAQFIPGPIFPPWNECQARFSVTAPPSHLHPHQQKLCLCLQKTITLWFCTLQKYRVITNREFEEFLFYQLLCSTSQIRIEIFKTVSAFLKTIWISSKIHSCWVHPSKVHFCVTEHVNAIRMASLYLISYGSNRIAEPCCPSNWTLKSNYYFIYGA